MQDPDTVWFDQLTSPEVDALDRERTILVLPTGCTEQQGPHLPLEGDTFLVSLFLSEAARRARAEGIVPTCCRHCPMARPRGTWRSPVASASASRHTIGW